MTKILMILTSLLLLGSCVSSKKYKSLQEEMENAKMSLQKCNDKLANCDSDKSKMEMDHKDQMSKMESDAKMCQGKVKSLEEQLELFKKTNSNLLERLSDLSIVMVPTKTGLPELLNSTISSTTAANFSSSVL